MGYGDGCSGYVCSYGDCQVVPELCHQTLLATFDAVTKGERCSDHGTSGILVCPGERNCVDNDRDCLRPCGTSFSAGFSDIYSYNERCDYWDKCLRDGAGLACPTGSKPSCPWNKVPCPDYGWRCVDKLEYCAWCSEEYRCGSGKCFGYADKCDGVQDCLDGKDELGCPEEDVSGGGPDALVIGLSVGGAVFGLFLICWLCYCCMKYCDDDDEGSGGSSHNVAFDNNGTNAGVVVSGVTPISNAYPAYIGPGTDADERPPYPVNSTSQPAPPYSSLYPPPGGAPAGGSASMGPSAPPAVDDRGFAIR